MFIGSGYVGLTSSILMSYLGHKVVCVDNDQKKIDTLNNGILPIYEPKLDEYLQHAIERQKIKFTTNYDLVNFQDIQAIFITVSTPQQASGEADLSNVYDVIGKICNLISQDCLLVIKSTVPPTSCSKMIKYLKEKGYNIDIAVNPEFLREGSAVEDFLNPDRIVIGINDQESEKILKKVYLPITSKGVQILSTDLVTAELIKYASNGFLATKIVFINEMADLCEKINANIKDLSHGVGLDQRIGQKFLNAGPGFGGSCFPKDTLALDALVQNYQLNSHLLKAVIKSNEMRPFAMVNKIEAILSNDLRDKNITILGLTYKAGTDDIRCSPAIEIIKILLSKGSNIKAFDPAGMSNASEYLSNERLLFTDLATNSLMLFKDTDAIVITTGWPEFIELDWSMILNLVRVPVIVDLRNILNPEKIRAIGFQYYSIGS